MHRLVRHTLTDTLARGGGVAPPLACGIWHIFTIGAVSKPFRNETFEGQMRIDNGST